jgi:hypothetical protein
MHPQFLLYFGLYFTQRDYEGFEAGLMTADAVCKSLCGLGGLVDCSYLLIPIVWYMCGEWSIKR